MKETRNSNNNNGNSSSVRNEVKLAVMSEKITNIETNVSEIKSSLKNLQHSMDDGYARKIDLAETQKEVDSLKNNVGWAVKIVLGAVILAILGLVIVNRPL